MAEWVGDQMVVKLDGGNLAAEVDVSARWKSVSLDSTVDPIEVTRGSSKKHKKFVPGMHEYQLEITLGIDDASIYPEELELDQIYTVTIAPNGETAGEPLHVQDFFITSVPIEFETGRNERVYSVSFKQAGDPATNIFELGVVPA